MFKTTMSEWLTLKTKTASTFKHTESDVTNGGSDEFDQRPRHTKDVVLKTICFLSSPSRI